MVQFTYGFTFSFRIRNVKQKTLWSDISQDLLDDKVLKIDKDHYLEGNLLFGCRASIRSYNESHLILLISNGFNLPNRSEGYEIADFTQINKNILLFIETNTNCILQHDRRTESLSTKYFCPPENLTAISNIDEWIYILYGDYLFEFHYDDRPSPYNFLMSTAGYKLIHSGHEGYFYLLGNNKLVKSNFIRESLKKWEIIENSEYGDWHNDAHGDWNDDALGAAISTSFKHIAEISNDILIVSDIGNNWLTVIDLQENRTTYICDRSYGDGTYQYCPMRKPNALYFWRQRSTLLVATEQSLMYLHLEGNM